MALHVVHSGAGLAFEVPPVFLERSSGYTSFAGVSEVEGATHMEFVVSELAPGGFVDAHLHSYEESFYIIEGSMMVDTTEGSFTVETGDYGLLPLGVTHALRNPSGAVARFAEMRAPLPRARTGQDTYFPSSLSPTEPKAVDVRDPRTRRFGHIEGWQMDPSMQTQDRLAVSASMRSALLVYSGITVKMMVDSDLGADLSTMFMVQYEPGGFAGAHDHPLEEAYLILEGEVEAAFDGERYHLGVGDVAWAGAGCVHEFRHVGDGPVRWLETQAPQPPGRHSYRFARDWTYLGDAIANQPSPGDTKEGAEDA
jgi:quercetin dioxygenase-like cupin family protein